AFGELWDQEPQYQYSELRSRLQRGDLLALGLQRPMSSYQIYAVLEGYPRSEERLLELPVTREGRRLGTIRQVLARSYGRTTPEGRGLAFSMLYQYALDPNHRKVRALRDMAALCRS